MIQEQRGVAAADFWGLWSESSQITFHFQLFRMVFANKKITLSRSSAKG